MAFENKIRKVKRKNEGGYAQSSIFVSLIKFVIVFSVVVFGFNFISSHIKTKNSINAEVANAAIIELATSTESLKVQSGGKMLIPTIVKEPYDESNNHNVFVVSYGDERESVKVEDKKLDFKIVSKDKNAYVIEGWALNSDTNKPTYSFNFITYSFSDGTVEEDYSNGILRMAEKLIEAPIKLIEGSE